MFGNWIITQIFFMNKAISKKNTFISFKEQFISLLRREENNIDTPKSLKKGVINDYADECTEK